MFFFVFEAIESDTVCLGNAIIPQHKPDLINLFNFFFADLHPHFLPISLSLLEPEPSMLTKEARIVYQ